MALRDPRSSRTFGGPQAGDFRRTSRDSEPGNLSNVQRRMKAVENSAIRKAGSPAGGMSNGVVDMGNGRRHSAPGGMGSTMPMKSPTNGMPAPPASPKQRMSNGGSPQGPPRPPMLSPAGGPEPPAADRFSEIMQQLERSHNYTVDLLEQEIKELKTKLDSVINATWNIAQDSWVATPKGDKDSRKSAGNLRLAIQDPNAIHEEPRGGEEMWTVSNDFREQKKIEEELQKSTGPAAFDIKMVWLAGKEKAGAQRNGSKTYASWAGGEGENLRRTKDVLNTSRDGAANWISDSSFCGRKIIMEPSCKKRLVWDIIGMLLLLWDMVTVPMASFGIAEVLFVKVMDWLILLFWTGDIAMSFCTGFINTNGTVVMVPAKIAKHYMSSRWFCLDLLVVGPDWIFSMLELSSSGDDGSMSSLVKTCRVFRVLRLLRVQKLRKLFVILQDKIESEGVFFVIRITQLVLVVVLLANLLACLFHAVGVDAFDRGLNNRESWIEAYDMTHRNMQYRYFTSLNWAMTNFAPGSYAAVAPTNAGERVFAVGSLIFGMLVILIFTAWTTSALIMLQRGNDELNKQFWLLRAYLRNHRVQPQLKTRLLRYLNNKVGSTRSLVQESKLDVLELLSDSLRSELQVVVSYGDLLKHPLFGHLATRSVVIMQGLVRKVLHVSSLAAEDVLFQRGIVASSMYYVSVGELVYLQQGDNPAFLTKEDWMCEHCLWVQWGCRGQCEATEDCQIITIDAKALEEVMQEDEELLVVVSLYAEAFCKWLCDRDARDLTDCFFSGRSRQLNEEFLSKAKKNAHQLPPSRTSGDLEALS